MTKGGELSDGRPTRELRGHDRDSASSVLYLADAGGVSLALTYCVIPSWFSSNKQEQGEYPGPDERRLTTTTAGVDRAKAIVRTRPSISSSCSPLPPSPNLSVSMSSTTREHLPLSATLAPPLAGPPTTTMTTPPQTLHKFTQLPPELRNIIWELSLPPPRVFDLYPASSSQKTPAHQGLRFSSPRSEPPPALAAVCRESRSLALHFYQPLTLGGGCDTEGKPVITTTKYINLSRDVLLLESCLFERNLFRALFFMGKIPLIRDNLRSLAFGTSYGVHMGIWHPVVGWRTPTRNNMGRFLQRLGAFEALDKLLFVVHQEFQLEVEELPRSMLGPALTPGTELAVATWNAGGDVVGNATLYQKGTEPPRSRSLMLEGSEDDSASSRASTPSSIMSETSLSSVSSCEGEKSEDGSSGSNSNFCRVPWVDDKPWLPHVNEIYYYPDATADPEEGSDKTSGLEVGGQPSMRGPLPTVDDWARFQRAAKREMELGMTMGLAEAAAAAAATKNEKTATTPTATAGPNTISIGRRKRSSDDHDLRQTPKRLRKAQESKRRSQIPSIEGASLLWRYSQGTY